MSLDLPAASEDPATLPHAQMVQLARMASALAALRTAQDVYSSRLADADAISVAVHDQIDRELTWGGYEHLASDRGRALEFAVQAYEDISGRVLAAGFRIPLATEIGERRNGDSGTPPRTESAIRSELDRVLSRFEDLNQDQRALKRRRAEEIGPQVVDLFRHALSLLDEWDVRLVRDSYDRAYAGASDLRRSAESEYQLRLAEHHSDLGAAARLAADFSGRLLTPDLTKATFFMSEIALVESPVPVPTVRFAWMPVIHGGLLIGLSDLDPGPLVHQLLVDAVSWQTRRIHVHLVDLAGTFAFLMRSKALVSAANIDLIPSQGEFRQALELAVAARADMTIQNTTDLWIVLAANALQSET